MYSRNCGKNSASVSVSPEMLQNTPISRLLLDQAAHDLHAAEQQQIVDHAHQPGRFGDLDVLRRHDQRTVFGPEPRQRLVEAQLALRQADDRLQIEIDAVFFQAGADGFQQVGFAQRVEIGARGVVGAAFDELLLGDRSVLGLFGDAGGEIAHQPFEQLQFGDDLLALGAGLGLERRLHLVHLAARVFEREGGFLAGLLQAADVRGPRRVFSRRRRIEAWTWADSRNSTRPDQTRRSAARRRRTRSSTAASGGGGHRIGRDDQGIGHGAPPGQSSAIVPAPRISNPLTKLQPQPPAAGRLCYRGP